MAEHARELLAGEVPDELAEGLSLDAVHIGQQVTRLPGRQEGAATRAARKI